jgi:hypothetical protein
MIAKVIFFLKVTKHYFDVYLLLHYFLEDIYFLNLPIKFTYYPHLFRY